MKKYIVSLIVVLVLTVAPLIMRLAWQPADDLMRSVANSTWFWAEICVGVIAICNLTSFITSWVNKRWTFTAGKIIYVVVNAGVIAVKAYVLFIMEFAFMMVG